MKKPSNLLVRTVVAVAGGAAFIAIVVGSFQATTALFAVLAFSGLIESLRLVKLAGHSRATPLAIALILLSAAPFNYFTGIIFFLTLFVLAGLKYSRLLDLLYPAQTLAGFGAAVLLRWERGAWFLLLVLFATWASDVGAYAVGSKIGRTKLAPAISPNKTREGAIGGLVAATIVGSLFGWAAGIPTAGAIFGIIAGSAGQLGDLAESRLKRLANVKDSGAVLPGHGGVLDRFDAFLVNAPLCYGAACLIS